MKYRIGAKEVWEQMYEVEASSKEEAIEKLETFMFDEIIDEVRVLEDEFELDYVLEKDQFVVYENNS